PPRIVPGRRVLPEVLGQDVVDLAVAAPQLERGLGDSLHRDGQELGRVAASAFVHHGLAAAQPPHLPRPQLHPFPAARRRPPRRNSRHRAGKGAARRAWRRAERPPRKRRAANAPATPAAPPATAPGTAPRSAPRTVPAPRSTRPIAGANQRSESRSSLTRGR